MSGALTGSDVRVVTSEFLFSESPSQLPFARCHASTIVETPGGLVAACFGGLHEGHADVGVWLTRGFEGSWTPPREVANGLQGDGTRLPCWNPVLFRLTAGPLLLFYKCGPRPGTWWGLVRRSYDHGATWDAACRLPEGFLGPIKNKPVESPDGELLCPSSSEHAGWRVHFERTSDGGKTWEHSGPINDGFRFAAIQPSILRHGDGRLQVICRSKCKKVVQSWSDDRGRTWSSMTSTTLPNPNSGTDAVTLADGRQLLVYNHDSERRTPLNVAVSMDGVEWKVVLALETDRGEYSYPAVIQTTDGRVHVTYTWKRRNIKHVTIDPGTCVPAR